jgi:hypothetical protein
MNGQIEVALHLRQRPRAEPFVADRIAVGHAEREGGVLVEAEIGGVVVIDDDGDVGLQLRKPFAHGHVSVEERFPRRLLRAVAVDHRADRRHMRKADAADDLAHQRASLILRVARNCW